MGLGVKMIHESTDELLTDQQTEWVLITTLYIDLIFLLFTLSLIMIKNKWIHHLPSKSWTYIRLVLADLATEEIHFLGAGLGKQTWSRYLVEKYLKHYKWYYPNRDNADTPPLANGWAYFEHFTLPRRFVNKSGGNHIRAPPGERHHTKLYSVLGTPLDSLSDWGHLLESLANHRRMSWVLQHSYRE